MTFELFLNSVNKLFIEVFGYKVLLEVFQDLLIKEFSLDVVIFACIFIPHLVEAGIEPCISYHPMPTVPAK